MDIVLARNVHHFDADSGSCSAGLIVGVDELADGKVGATVKAWHADGNEFTRTSVPHSASPSTSDDHNSFHQTRDCPWSR